MTRYEARNKKAKQRRRMILSLSLIAIGLVLVITAAIMEASHYPWGLLFGTATQNADTIPDPTPIKLDEEDQNVTVTEEAPSADPSASDSAAAPETDSSNQPSPSEAAALPGSVEDTKKAPAVTKYVVLGTLKIPVLKVSQNVLEGAGKQMKYGVGHVPSTAAVGQAGNCAIAGHRPYPFRYLDQLKSGDKIVLKSGGVTYTYTVFDSFAVLPDEVWVLDSIPGEDYTLTLITCTPYMVSSHRLIVRARLTDIDGKTPQDYYGIPSPAATPGDSTEHAPTDMTVAPPPSAEITPSPSVVPADAAAASPSEAPTETQPAEAAGTDTQAAAT